MKNTTRWFPIILFVLIFASCKKEDAVLTVQNIALNKTEISIIQGDSTTLSVAFEPVGTKADISWSSSNEKVAKVTNGLVKAVAKGTAIITASTGMLTSNCSVVVTREDLPYKLIWADEFEGTALDVAKWQIEQGGNGWGNLEKQNYTDRSKNLRIENGSLVIEAFKETFGSNNYTSARITTKDKVSFKYGKIEARISLPVGKGTWPAFWTLGSSITYSRWPLCGEIDIMEHIGSDPTMISHAVHTSEKNGSKGNNWYSRKYLSNLENNYHTYGIEWEEKASEGDDNISFFIDGVKSTTLWEQHINSTSSNWPFNEPNFLILNLALGGKMGGTIDDNIFANQVIMKVDYVRVYQRK